MEQPNFEQNRFLIVDDEPQNIEILTLMLKQLKATQIFSTTRPYEALSLFRSSKPDVILLDLMMPILDGFGVMELLKPLISPEEFLPFVVLTANSHEKTKRLALERGAADFLTKPFDPIELSLRIENLLARRELTRRLQCQNQNLDQKVQERTRQLAQSELDTSECLAMAAEYRDDDTGGHTRRVSDWASRLADNLGLDEAECDLIHRSAPLHDVGRIGIPDTILFKPDKLTFDEFEVMKTHTFIGAAILERHHTPLLQQAASIALTHHERWNGAGYPEGRAGEEIPLAGRIVAVVDVFDALIHDRPYKKAWPLEQAVAEIESQSGAHFDPAVVSAFSQMVSEGI